MGAQKSLSVAAGALNIFIFGAIVAEALQPTLTAEVIT